MCVCLGHVYIVKETPSLLPCSQTQRHVENKIARSLLLVCFPDPAWFCFLDVRSSGVPCSTWPRSEGLIISQGSSGFTTAMEPWDRELS